MRPPVPKKTHPLRTRRWTAREVAALVLILIVAAAMRMGRMEAIPPGLYIDEAAVARLAMLWRDRPDARWYEATPLFDAGWVETSNLYLAYVSTVMRVFGDGFWGVRMASVLPSLACVLLIHLLGRMLQGPRVGLLAAALLAASHWAARTGRSGWDEVLMTALQLAAMCAMVWSLRSRSMLQTLARSACAAVALAACLHTYVASRLVAAMLALWGVWETWRSKPRRRVAAAFALCLLLAAVLCAPYFHYLLTRSAAGAEVRTGELSVFQHFQGFSLVKEVASNTLAHLLMFNFRGGIHARDNLPGFSMLDPLTGIAMLLGVLWLFTKAGSTRRIMVCWFAVCVLGGVLSVSREGAPYVYRVANLAPWACLLAAIGAMWAARCLRHRLPMRCTLRKPVAAALLACVLIINGSVIFVLGPRCPDTYPVFGTVETQLGLWLARHPHQRPCVIHVDAFDQIKHYRDQLRYPHVNGYDVYTPGWSLATVQWLSGAYRVDPRMLHDPLRPNALVVLANDLPEEVTGPTLLVVPPALLEQPRLRFTVAEHQTLRDALHRPLCELLWINP